ALATAWGVRLTWNFARKGGYKPGEEDYRWPYLRKHVITNPVAWALFNLTFISLYQTVLLFLIVAPVAIAATSSAIFSAPWSAWDTACSVAFLVFLLGETVADNQQFAFQTTKHRLLKQAGLDNTSVHLLPEPFAHGFLSAGLFAYCRHPNFFCEICMWWAMAAFTVRTVPVSALGAFLLTTLFLGSTAFTELISSQKYPLYAVYKTTTSALVPWIPGTPLSLAKTDR
ncbi:hypothetical protein BC831DRAFT_385416, partial [Entophlyctis helioformis]